MSGTRGGDPVVLDVRRQGLGTAADDADRDREAEPARPPERRRRPADPDPECSGRAERHLAMDRAGATIWIRAQPLRNASHFERRRSERSGTVNQWTTAATVEGRG
ncbi:hypothetical protein Acsp06_62820 [Actinomycetospora sp. NBRC 106375]|nr:hypothetical protein Acsp06_62820 [Actinomycetospora sp. NBRC 106375]